MRQINPSSWATPSPLPSGMTHTEPAGADVLDSGLPARAEALVGRVDGPVGKEGVGSHKAKGGDASKHPLLLVDELHGPAGTDDVE